MYHLSCIRVWAPLFLSAGAALTADARADAVTAVEVLRAGGCGGILPAAPPLRRNELLDRTAAEWAAGRPLHVAAERSGYTESTAGLHASGADSAIMQLIRRSGCNTVMSRRLSDIGVYHRGFDTWLVLGPAFAASTATPMPMQSSAPARTSTPQARVPTPVSSAGLASRALELVNEVRARGTRCGARSFAPAPPVTLSWTLAGVAFGHALDMAEHDYVEHEDLAGQSPADRVRAVGYREKLVGENIAYGPKSVEEVVQGWLESPGHCENIMDPRFVEMGIAYAAGHAARHGLYWVQLLVQPRA